MTLKRAISDTVYTRLVSTTSILAKLAVCAILLAGINCARAAGNDGSNESGVAHSNLVKLESEWKRQRSQLGMLRRFVACRELGQCQGLVLDSTLGSMAVRSVVTDADETSPSLNGGGEHREWTFGGLPSANR